MCNELNNCYFLDAFKFHTYLPLPNSCKIGYVDPLVGTKSEVIGDRQYTYTFHYRLPNLSPNN